MGDPLHKPSDQAVLSRSKRLSMAIILGILAAFGPLSMDMYLPALPNIAIDFHTNASFVQLTITFFVLGLALGQLLTGPISDVTGRRKPLLIGLMAYFIVSLLCVFSPSIWGLIILRFIQGFAGSAGVVISRAIVRDLYSGSELTKFFSLLALINGLAPILAPVLGGQLLKVVPWQGVFIVLSAIGIVMFFVVLFGLPETLQEKQRTAGGIKNTFHAFSKLITDRTFMGYALAQGLVTACLFSYISGSPFVIQDIYEASPQTFSLIFAVNAIGIMICSQTTGRLAGKISESTMFKFGLGMAALGAIILLILIFLQAKLLFLLIPLFFVVSSVGMVNTSGFSLAMQTQGKNAGSASALLGVTSFALGGIVSPLVGIGGGHTAIPMGVVMACTGCGSILTYLILVKRKRRGIVNK